MQSRRSQGLSVAVALLAALPSALDARAAEAKPPSFLSVVKQAKAAEGAGDACRGAELRWSSATAFPRADIGARSRSFESALQDLQKCLKSLPCASDRERHDATAKVKADACARAAEFDKTAVLAVQMACSVNDECPKLAPVPPPEPECLKKVAALRDTGRWCDAALHCATDAERVPSRESRSAAVRQATDDALRCANATQRCGTDFERSEHARARELGERACVFRASVTDADRDQVRVNCEQIAAAPACPTLPPPPAGKPCVALADIDEERGDWCPAVTKRTECARNAQLSEDERRNQWEYAVVDAAKCVKSIGCADTKRAALHVAVRQGQTACAARAAMTPAPVGLASSACVEVSGFVATCPVPQSACGAACRFAIAGGIGTVGAVGGFAYFRQESMSLGTSNQHQRAAEVWYDVAVPWRTAAIALGSATFTAFVLHFAMAPATVPAGSAKIAIREASPANVSQP